MALRPAYLWNGSGWDQVADPRVGNLQSRLSSAETILAARGQAGGLAQLGSDGKVLAAQQPLELVGRYRRTANATGTTATAATSATSILRLTVPGLQSGRCYRIRADGIHTSATASQAVGYQFTYTSATPGNTPAAPTVSSTLIEQGFANTGPIASVSTSWALFGLLVPASAMTVTILLSYWRVSGANTVTCQASTSSPLDVLVEDLGPDVLSSGANL